MDDDEWMNVVASAYNIAYFFFFKARIMVVDKSVSISFGYAADNSELHAGVFFLIYLRTISLFIFSCYGLLTPLRPNDLLKGLISSNDLFRSNIFRLLRCCRNIMS